MATQRHLSIRWFTRLWAVAVVAHVIGNPRVGQLWPETTALGVSTVTVGLVAVAMLVVPDSRWLLVASAIGVPVVAWFEAPFIGNHWVAAVFVSVALLSAVRSDDWWTSFAPTGRWILLGFYTWAAFNKLNAGFFDPDVSCGVVYANQWLDAAGLGTLDIGGVAAWSIAFGTTVIELTVPLLLVFRRTRRWGVLLGFAFHGLISLDLGQHFYDFTSLLLALFTLFLSDGVTARLEQRITGPRLRQVLLAGLAAILVVVSVSPPTRLGLWLVQTGVFLLWIPTLVAVIVATAQGVRASPADDIDLRLRRPIGVLLVTLVVFNGFTPYLEIKTGYGWNMYANLVTADGESNHFVLRRTVPLTDVQGRLAEIVESNDPGLMAYVGSGYVLPERRLLHHLAEHPEAFVVYRVGSEQVEGTGEELGERLPALVDKFLLFRAVDIVRPPRCQTTWLPAR